MLIRLMRGPKGSDGIGSGGIAAALSVVLVLGGVVYRPLSYAASLFVACYLIFAPPEQMWYEMFVLLPFANVFKFSPTTASVYTYLQLIVVGRVLLKRKRIDPHFLLALAVLLAINFIGSDSNITVFIKQSMIPLMMYCFFRSKPRYRTLVLCYVSGVLAASAVAVFREYIPNLTSYVGWVRAWELTGYVYRFCGLNTDPNFYSLSLLMALIGAMTLYNSGQLGRWFFVIYAAVGGFGLMTISKSFLLMYAAVSCVFALMQFRKRRFGWSLMLTAGLILIAVLSLQGRISILDNVLSRLFSGDLSTNRTTLWGEYLTYLGGDPVRLLIGRGIGAPYLDSGYAPHNTYLDFAYYYGVIGTFVFAVCCWQAMGRTQKICRGLNHGLMVGGLGVLLFFLSGLHMLDFGYMLILACMAWQSRGLRRKP